jgi:glycosyltransferase involved in cell wall biosynthesis
MMLGRICPEKGFHIALDAAVRARIPALLAGDVFRYEAHERYFRDEIVPRLDGLRRFIGPVGLARKRRLLAAARCLLVPSLAPETSSLVAMEALACGTPVIAFPSGALPDIVEHEKTGFLVHDAREMAHAIEAAGRLDPEVCRRTARARFALDTMTRRYVALYKQLVAQAGPAAICCAGMGEHEES